MTGCRLAALFACFTAVGCAGAPEPIDAGSSEYFGFVAVACGYDDPTDNSVRSDYIDEVAGFTNIAHLCVFGPDHDVSAALDALQSTGSRALLDVTPLFFESVQDSTDPARFRYVPRADSADRWAQFTALNADHLDAAHVAAVYPADEPFWNGLNAEQLGAAATIVDGSHPDLPLLLIEGYPALADMVIPEAFDWVGFDRYDTIDPASDPAWLADVATLKSKRSRPDQKLVLVMDTAWRPYYADAGVQPSDMEAIGASTMKVAAAEPDTIAVIGYLWPGGLDLPDQIGARGLPDNVHAFYERVGEATFGPVATP